MNIGCRVFRYRCVGLRFSNFSAAFRDRGQCIRIGSALLRLGGGLRLSSEKHDEMYFSMSNNMVIA